MLLLFCVCILEIAEYMPLLQRIESSIDIKHFCGYVTLLKTGARYNWPSCANNTSSATGIRDNAGVTELSCISCDRNELFDCNADDDVGTMNGVKDELSAEMLASEVDSLNDEVSHVAVAAAIENKDIQPLATNEGSHHSQSKLQTDKNMPKNNKDLQSDWLVLDCHFGIPLFDIDLNHAVLERLQTNGIFFSERYLFLVFNDS